MSAERTRSMTEEKASLQSRRPRVVVFSSLFPNRNQPGAGLFIRERMFRVGRELPIVVVSPQPWFPFQGLIRTLFPQYRIPAPRRENQQGVDVFFPRFLAFPGVMRRFDGFFMALGAFPTIWRLKRAGMADLIDAHFGYPAGHAATLIGKWLGLPVTVTLRGTEPGHARNPALRAPLVAGLRRANRLFAVSRSLKGLAIKLGAPEGKVRIIGNGVDLGKFRVIPKAAARSELNLPLDAPVLVTVGGLVERKGFHRVIDCLPSLLARFPRLYYVIVGGPSPEGDMSVSLRNQVEKLGLGDRVLFTGPLPPERLHVPLSAADVFVLATRNEGWANVFLEAMACGLPVVTTDVGGNADVVSRRDLGIVVPFGDEGALAAALTEALDGCWDHAAIRTYAAENTWDRWVEMLVSELEQVYRESADRGSEARQHA